MSDDQARNRVNVLGAGVIGLSCACELANYYDVTVIADNFGIETDSIKATAIWHVYLVPETTQVLAWAERTLSRLLELSRDHPDSDISLVEGVELFRNSEPIAPSWAHIPPLFNFLTATEVDAFNAVDKTFLNEHEIRALDDHPIRWGYRIQAPVVSMDKYLPWLESLAHKRNVKFDRLRVSNLAGAANDCDALVNCTGFGARELVGDTEFVSYKGQYFVLKGSSLAPTYYIGDDDHPGGMAYMIPRSGEVLVGGCAEEGVENLDLTLNWDEVIRRAGLYVPWLRGRNPSEQSRPPVVGLRPARREGVRLELDLMSCQIPVVHNYGHGGSGFSLSWGCAETVSAILSSALSVR